MMFRSIVCRRAGVASLALPLAFLVSCGSSGGDNLFSGTTGGVSSNGGSNAQSGGNLTGSGGSESGGQSSAGISGAAASGGILGSGGTVGGGIAMGGRANTSGGVASGGMDATTGGSVSEGGAEVGGVAGGAPQAGASGSGTPGGGGQAGAAAGGVGGGGGSAGGGAVPCTAIEEVCDGLDNNCNGTVDEGKACPADCDGFVSEGHGYMFCRTETVLGKAQLACEGQGMRLAWIETAVETEALLPVLKSLAKSGMGPVMGGAAAARIGATDVEVEGEWHWIGGDPFWSGANKGTAVGGAYENWADMRPNDNGLGGKDCATLAIGKGDDGAPGEWNDVACAEIQPYLCETP